MFREIMTSIGTAIVLSFVSLFSTDALARGGMTGSGGDPLRVVFADGRELALKTLRSISVDQARDTGMGVADWLRENHLDLILAVQGAVLNWSENPDAITCARTRVGAGIEMEVTLAFVACRGTRTNVEAAKVLIHEAVHSLGVIDEEFADQVAEEVFAIQARMEAGQMRLCPNVEDQVAKLLPGKWIVDQTLVGRFLPADSPLTRVRISFERNDTLVTVFPALAPNVCAQFAGWITFENFRDGNRKVPSIIVAAMGNTYLVWNEGNESFRNGLDLESSVIQLTSGLDRSKDVFFLGGDSPDQGEEVIPLSRANLED